MKLEHKFGDHTEVAASPTDSEIQILVFSLVRGQNRAIGRHHSGLITNMLYPCRNSKYT